MRGPASLVMLAPGAEPPEAPALRWLRSCGRLRRLLDTCRLVIGLPMLKKLLIVAGVVGAAALIVKRVKASSDERALWHEATTAPDLR